MRSENYNVDQVNWVGGSEWGVTLVEGKDENELPQPPHCCTIPRCIQGSESVRT